MDNKFRVFKYFIAVIMLLEMAMVIYLLCENRELQKDTNAKVTFINEYCLE